MPEPRAEGEPSMSAQIITVAQHKGGAGKTTLAAHLAVSWAEAGRRVALLDTDPQTSLGVWYGQRQSGMGRRAQPLAYAVASGWHVRSELDRLSRISDLVLVDTPPGSGLDIRTSLKSSAAVLVPVQPSPLDLWATQAVLDEIRREGSRSLIVLTRVPARARLTAEVVAELARLQTSIAEARLEVGRHFEHRLRHWPRGLIKYLTFFGCLRPTEVEWRGRHDHADTHHQRRVKVVRSQLALFSSKGRY